MCGAKVIGENQKFCAECGFKLVIENNVDIDVKHKDENGKMDCQLYPNTDIKETAAEKEDLSAKELESKGKDAIKNKEYKKALDYYTRSYDKGNKDAAFFIGAIYANGQGVTRDDRIAEKWFRKLDRKMDGEDSYFLIGVMYYKGQMIPKNIQIAIKWFEMAAYNGNMEAAMFLGNLYFQGDEVPKDIQRSVKWLEIASKGKNYDANVLLGGIYLDGSGVIKRDSKKGLAYLKGAANAGIPQAMWILGKLYEKGNIDIRADKEKSRKWYERAAQAGYRR
jgi:hypothetical protein